MGIILDTDVIIRSEKGIFDLRRWVAGQAGERLEVSAITVAELRHGAERATEAYRARREQYIEVILSMLPVIPYTGQIAYVHARLWAELEMCGKMIGFYDLIVAATALERGSAVATFNTKHFAQVKGLKVVKPE